MPRVKTETAAAYAVPTRSDDDAIIARALEILSARMHKPQGVIGGPQDVRSFLTLSLAERDHEVFGVIFCTAQNGVIAYEEMFRGTLTQASVYPREVVKRALTLNAAGVILTHNHPSGVPEPSHADEALTTALKTALALVDVKVLDHIVIGGDKSVSFAERGLL